MPVKLSLAASNDVLGGIRMLPDNVHDKIAYRSGRVGTYITSAMKEYLVRRGKILTSLGVAASAKPTGEALAKFMERNTALLEEIIEIPFEPMKIGDVQRNDPNSPDFYVEDASERPKIAPSVLMALEPFLVYPDETPAEPPAAKKKAA
jgi:hypothetical protein